MQFSTRLTAIILVLFILSACTKNTPVSVKEPVQPKLPVVPYAYSQLDFIANLITISPEDFGLVNVLRENPPVTDWGATLGRVLFYDPKLSLNNAVSCASCHKQEFAFADPVAHSRGFEGRITPRNSMAVINPIITDDLFWDFRASSVYDLTLQPVQNHIEMGIEDMEVLTDKLSAIDYYPELFEKAFKTSEITSEHIASALSQFLCSMTTFNSRYDRAVQDDNFEDFTPLESLGKELFFSDKLKCASCHGGINFSGTVQHYNFNSSSSNIGLDFVDTESDKTPRGFRIPSLRNIAKTAPYMHDGRFATLDDVLEHYSSGIQANPLLDNKLRNPDGTPIRLHLTGVEKEALKAFLKTLTDEEFLRDEKYSNPFKS